MIGGHAFHKLNGRILVGCDYIMIQVNDPQPIQNYVIKAPRS